MRMTAAVRHYSAGDIVVAKSSVFELNAAFPESWDFTGGPNKS
jgi:hypothetical protein